MKIFQTDTYPLPFTISEVLTESLEALIVSLIVSAIFAPIMIAILYRTNQVSGHKKSELGGGVEGTNELFLKVMNVTASNGTPNVGGILVWFVVPIVTFMMVERNTTINIFLLGFILFGLWGFIDVVVTNRMKSDEAFRILQEKFGMRLFRFFLSALINVAVIWLVYDNNILPSIEISLFKESLRIDFEQFALILIPLLVLIAHFAVYSAEIIDGLDGLMIGIFGIIYTGLGALLLAEGYYSLLPIIGIVIGVIFVDLYFNIPPARFFNGGPGAMTLGFGAFYIGLVTNNLLPYFIMSGWTWIVMSTSMIQILSMKFRKKRVFKIAPLHHHFQAVGWPSYKVTMRFWLITMLLVTLGLYVGVAQ